MSVDYVLTESGTKSGKVRTVDLDPGTVAALQAHRRRQAAERLALGPVYQDRGLVFAREDGEPIHPEHLLAAACNDIERGERERLTGRDLSGFLNGRAHVGDGRARVEAARLVLERYASVDVPSLLPAELAEDPNYRSALRVLFQDPHAAEDLSADEIIALQAADEPTPPEVLDEPPSPSV